MRDLNIVVIGYITINIFIIIDFGSIGFLVIDIDLVNCINKIIAVFGFLGS